MTARHNDQNARVTETRDLIAWTTTTLNSSGISDMNDVICFINRSTLLSLPVYNTHLHCMTNTTSTITATITFCSCLTSTKSFFDFNEGRGR